MELRAERVEYQSARDISIAADLYLPLAPQPPAGYPAVVICLGWGSVRELMQPWGDALRARGFAILVPDYRGFGGSGGERGRCFPAEHGEDIRAGLRHTAGLPYVDSARIALVGVSYGGAVAVAVAGSDPTARAVVSVVGYGSGKRHLQALRTEREWRAFMDRLEADRHRRTCGEASAVIDPDEILVRNAEARAWRRSVEKQFPHMAFQTTLESAERIVEFEPERSLPYSTPKPVMFIHAEKDEMIPVEESHRMWSRAQEPKELVILPGIGHHEVHRDGGFKQTIDHIERWLTLHMRPTA